MLEGTILLSVSEHLQHDVDVFPLHIIIDCPLKVIPLRGGGGCPCIRTIKRKIERVAKLDRTLVQSGTDLKLYI